MTTYLDTKKIYPALSTSILPQAADLITYYLDEIGVEYIFGVPGGAIEPLYNALARSRRRGGIAPVVARHESGAAFMADGYARETGKLGVCCTTTGPGATNIITGVASAYQDDIPLLVITAQTPISTFGRGAVQESSCTAVNTTAMMACCTRYNTLVSHAEQLERKLIAAITTALHEHGPAHLSIPLDILRTPVNLNASSARLDSLTYEHQGLDSSMINSLCRRIQKSARTVIVVGEGCRKATLSISKFAQYTGALIVTTPQGKGLIDSYHPNYRGGCGLAGHQSAQNLLFDPSVDLVLIVGSSLDEQAAQGWLENESLFGKLVHIDNLKRHFLRSQHADMHVLGNIPAVFNSVLANLAGETRSGQKPWDTRIETSGRRPNVVYFERRANDRRRLPRPRGHSYIYEKRLAERRGSNSVSPLARSFAVREEAQYSDGSVPIKPQRLMYDLSRLLPPDTCFLADIGNSFLWGIHYLHPYHPPAESDASSLDYFRTSMGFASMGWAIGAAVGTALANPKRPVVCLVGDGSYLMSGQEITTAMLHKLSVIFVILNDGALGTVKHGQRLAKAEAVGYELPAVDYAAMAKVLGVESYRVESPDDMQEIDFKRITRRHMPVLIDCRIDGDEVPPLKERMDMLTGHQ